MARQNPNLPPEIPPHLSKWNWGAFFLNWIWGIGNQTFVAFLMFVPFVNLVMPFVLGAKGSKWAWQNQYWRDEDHFKKTQRNWAIGGFVVFALSIAFFAALFTALPGIMKSSDAYKTALSELQASPQIIEVLGEPIEDGFMPTGNISVNGGSGKAQLAFNLSGPKGEGKAFMKAVKEGGVWDIYLLYFVPEGSKTPIVLRNSRNIRLPGGAIGT